MDNTQIDAGAAAPVDTLAQTDAAEYAELSAVFQKLDRDNGAERGDDGKFSAGADDGDGDDDLDDDAGNDGEADGDDQGAEEAAPPVVAKPANWYGMDAEWEAIPAEHRGKIAQQWNNIHQRLSDQGRRIKDFEPVAQVLDEYKDVYDGKVMPNGDPATPDNTIEFLLNAQRKISQNPVQCLIEIADLYGVRQNVAAAIASGVRPGQPLNSPRQERREAGISPADVERLVDAKWSEREFANEANAELSRLSKDKPLYAEIPQEDMIHAIDKARRRLGEEATRDAVFDLAYDMAVNADPDLRAKAAAAPTRQAAPENPRRTADQKRANAVNLTSTSTGKPRQMSEEDELRSAYRKAQG